MAKQHGKQANARKKPSPLRYFYLDGELDGKVVPLAHKKLHINRAKDQIITWCYPLRKRVTYTYSDVKKRKRPAFNTETVAKMLNRSRKTIEWMILDGNIKAPQHSYTLDENMRKFKYLWSEQDVLEAHAYLSTVHRGRPRKDGLITSVGLPSVRELRAMMRQDEVLYIKNEDGEYVPVWRAPDFD